MTTDNLNKKNWPFRLNIQMLILYFINNLQLIPIGFQLNQSLQHNIYNAMEFDLNLIYLVVK